VDFSTETDEIRVEGDRIVDHFNAMASGTAVYTAPVSKSSGDRRQRFFGEGDVLRNATLEFGENSVVDIQSRFEKCKIKLVEGSRLTVGPEGVLQDCHISGPGDVIVRGKFKQDESTPSIVGPRTLFVGETGQMHCAIKQHVERTRFGFEEGCEMQVRILK
jgi:hypothetical protein